MSSDLILPGDYVAVSLALSGGIGQKEGTVVGSHYDHLGRHIVHVQLDEGGYQDAWSPHVTRIKKTTRYYTNQGQRVERTVYW